MLDRIVGDFAYRGTRIDLNAVVLSTILSNI
jgi:hypothetical protein